MKEDRVLGLFLVQSLWFPGPRVGVLEETFWVDVYKAVADFVEHPQADLLSLVFKTCPFQVLEHGCNSTRWSVCVVVGHIPGRSALNFFHESEVLLLMGIPDSWGMLQCGAYHCGVGRWLNFWSTLPEIPSREPHCPVSLCCYILNISKPGQVTADSDAQILAGTCCFQCLPMEEVAGCQDFACWAWCEWRCIYLG